MKATCASPTTRSLIMPAAPVLLGICSISIPARLEKTSLSKCGKLPTPALVVEQACGNVGRTTGSIGHDHLHRPRGIFILCRGGHAACCEADQRQSQTEAFHRILPLNVLRIAARAVPAPMDCSAVASAG